MDTNDQHVVDSTVMTQEDAALVDNVKLPPAATPIPQAAKATSHVDCLDPSPPQPAEALTISPTDLDQAEETSALTAEPTDLPTLPSSPPDEGPSAVNPALSAARNESSTSRTNSTTSSVASSIPSTAEKQGKPHPADLVCVADPDPHRSPPVTPGTDESGEGTQLGHDADLARSFAEGRTSQEEEDEEDRAPTLREGLSSPPSLRGTISDHDRLQASIVDSERGTEADGVEMDAQLPPRVTGSPATDSPTPAVNGEHSSSADTSNQDTPVMNRSAVNGVAVPLPHGLEQSSSSTPKSDTSASPVQLTGSAAQEANIEAPPAPSKIEQTPASVLAAAASTGIRASTHREESAGRSNREREKRIHEGNSKDRGNHASGSTSNKESSSSRSRRQLGEYTLGKTLGAGSMGKVKLGLSSITGEKVAIKIIPRYTSTAAANRPPSSEDKDTPKQPTASFLEKAAAKDLSKEIRTMREGSLCLLLHHPYICGMKSMVLYPNHYYMVTEYVNGGQMLDYIISHGRLRERSARKFARQIGSALEYCHANSVVHRDLKIENILISKTGNIKIIDFGLSNLYSPQTHLTTFCGSLYFAAPELLNAKPYTGPEVDVWSFGIVLYVLVCGKVPFDDQSMPALHAKIKRGQVEYPAWLSPECKHLLSRMLVTTPTNRATLHEVLTHPWIVKGFSGPPSSHLPNRSPLKPEEIDRDIVKGMSGFDLGTEEEIYDRLIDVLVSEEYLSAVKHWEIRKASSNGLDGEADGDRPAMRVDGRDMKHASTSFGGTSSLGRSPTNKRFSGLGFYSKKIAGGINAAFSSGGSGGSGGTSKSPNDDSAGQTSSSTSTLISPSASPDALDPTRGFNPLISLYYLVKEKVEREKIWGPGVFASSTVSLTGPPPPPAPATAYQAGSGNVMPQPPPLSKPSSLVPAATNANTRDAHSAADSHRMPVGSPTMPLTPQPRQRATGDEFAHPSSAPHGMDRNQMYSAGTKRSSFMAPSASTPTSPAAAQRGFRQLEPPTTPTPGRLSPSQNQDSASGGSSTQRPPPSDDDDIPLSTSPSLFARRFGSLLGRSSSTSAANDDKSYSKGHRQRASIGVMAHRSSNRGAASPLPQVNEHGAGLSPHVIRTSGSDVPLPSPPEGKAVARASTVGEMSPNRHQRGQSMGGAISHSPTTRASVGSGSPSMPRPKTSGDVQGMFDEVEEEIVDVQEHGRSNQDAVNSTECKDEQTRKIDVGFVGRTASAHDSHEQQQAKPVWLKGLFSVSTTTTKSTATIRADLIRVLDRLGVQHRDVKSGFECAHVPSIDLASVGGGGKKDSSSGKGTIRRRASKLLLASKDKEHGEIDADESTASLGVPPPGSHTSAQAERPHTSSASFGVLPAPAEHQTNSSKGSPPGQAVDKFKSDGSTHTATTTSAPISNDMIVRFEIFIVKMPLLPGISGLQFRRIGGNAWQYQMLAKRILTEMKL
ncbi:Serine/threonine-protein kinase [Microbotryomycetes sp. JL221]|nr:Serine/threonine-protein kinase [Microbotryomycetes sp. JL221]